MPDGPAGNPDRQLDVISALSNVAFIQDEEAMTKLHRKPADQTPPPVFLSDAKGRDEPYLARSRK